VIARLSTRVRPSAPNQFWFLKDTSECIRFETVQDVSTKVDVRIIAGERPELCILHQIQHFTFSEISVGVNLGNCYRSLIIR
jgi:hypothetical protein